MNDMQKMERQMRDNGTVEVETDLSWVKLGFLSLTFEISSAKKFRNGKILLILREVTKLMLFFTL